MKLAYFDNFQLGILTDKGLVDVSHIIMDIPHTNPGNLMNGLIENFENYRSKLETAAEKGVAFPLDSIKIQPPLPKPGAIDCMAVNYMENGTLKEKPQINGFHKSPSAIIGNGDTMILPDVPATIFEGEAELGLIIGKRASNVSESDAMDHVFGYLNFIDGSARGLPPDRNVFFQVKSRATFAPIGPFIVTADEIPDPQNLSVKLWVNGELKQDFNTNDMAHKIPKAISWLSSIHALEPGDLIATGTNHRGLSSFQHGDKIELEVEMLGRLSINVQDDLRRTWGRETRLDRKNAGYETPTPQLTGKYAK
ncbi:MAG: fumarylacetoacetate hydrolase family protein [Thalassobaculaceae bacterium]|jgi:2-keto-4-pentenoate hydratase/2-oxohepta-3-ene-1,7-dioic acid hydratase in catechol pathway|nr:fumarylacetoacetate hydrolase [Rhodospirillaceae bacterium]OUU54083.1 MAG: fumarylacetoacetate hydrolase [Candidatus Endolissoclinum sp. TMED55]|tara:strand:+ start:5619 stop:6545 length:927 start_codon:yes stop_codon:yes gene_type:complete